MKKLLISLTFALMLVAIFVISVSAVEFTAEDGISYSTFTEDGVEKAMVSNGNRNLDMSIVRIPESVTNPNTGISYPVTRINGMAFNGNKNIVELYIPSTVDSFSTYEGSGFCENCSNLQTVVFAEDCGLKKIQKFAFSSCSSLTSITLPLGVEEILQSAFYNNTSLTTINGNTTVWDFSIFENLKDIGANAFRAASPNTLEMIVFPESLTKLPNTESFSGSFSGKITIVFLGEMTNINLANINAQTTIYFAKNHANKVNGAFAETNVYTSNNDKILTYVNQRDRYNVISNDDYLTISLMNSGTNSNTNNYTVNGETWGAVNTTQNAIYFCADNKVAYLVRTPGLTGSYDTYRGYFALFETDGETNYYDPNTKSIVVLTPHINSEDTKHFDATCTEAEKTVYYCLVCGEDMETVETAPALGHDLVNGTLKGIMYPNGFDKVGHKKIECARCREIDETTEALAMFGAKGYSISIEGDAIIGGYEILAYNELGGFIPLDEYEALYGALTYGIIFVNVNNTDTITFDESGIIQNSNAIQVRVSTPADKDDDDETENELRKYNEFKCKVAGFNKKYDDPTKQPKAMQLVISMYVLDNEGNISFIQSENAYDSKEVTANGVKLNVVTFNALYQKAGETDSMFGTPSEE